MLEKHENIFIVENQNLYADEIVRSNILKSIKDSKNFQDAMEKLEKEKLIWYLIGPLRKDEEIKKQINSKWEADFQKFEQSVKKTQDKIHSKLKGTLSDQSFLAYSTKDNDFNIRFESKEEPVKISDILRTSNEGEVYHIFLGEDSKITASKKNSNERHYDFTGSSSSRMTINWQAEDSKGNSIDSSMTVEVGFDGIQRVIGEPQFGNLKFTSSLSEKEKDAIFELIGQNKEVFINGKSLLEAFTGIGKNVSNQPVQKEETFIRNSPESPQSPGSDSSGYFSSSIPSSRRSSFSSGSEFSGEKERGQEENEENKIEELKNRIKELEKENTHLRKENAELKKLNQKIAEESDNREEKLTKEKQTLEEKVKKLEAELERKRKELAEKDKEIEQLKQQISILEQGQRDGNAKIMELNNQLKDKESKIRLTNRINEELQGKLEQNKSELSALKRTNVELENNLRKKLEGLEGGKEKQLEKQLMEIKKENKTLTDEVSRLTEELNQLQKEKEELEEVIQQSSGKSVADEMVEENKKKEGEVRNLEEGIKRKDEEMQQIVKNNHRLEKNLQDLDRKYREVSGKDKEHIAQLTYQLEQAKNKLVNDSNELNKQIESLREEKENLLEQLRTKSTGSASFRKQQSEIDSLKQQLKEKENMLIDTQEELKSVKEGLKQLQDISQQEEDQRETVAVSTQTEVRYESEGSVHHVGTGTIAPETRDWGTQAMDESLSKKISKLEQ